MDAPSESRRIADELEAPSSTTHGGAEMPWTGLSKPVGRAARNHAEALGGGRRGLLRSRLSIVRATRRVPPSVISYGMLSQDCCALSA